MPGQNAFLSLQAITVGLGVAACRFDVEVLDECASTNAELMARATQGAPSGSVVVAQRQTAGRGRMGREWIAAPGDSLTFSLLWRFPAGLSLSGLSLAVGVAVARALQKVGAGDMQSPEAVTASIRLKWPNDLLLAEKKVGGILIELAAPQTAVIGIGLNLRLPDAMPPEVREIAAAIGPGVAADRLLAAVLVELLQVLDTFAGNGFAALREEWLTLNAWSGRQVRVSSPSVAPVEGYFVGIDADGALLLEVGGSVQRILAGDVSLRTT